jgi:hypothetical protein
VQLRSIKKILRSNQLLFGELVNPFLLHQEREQKMIAPHGIKPVSLKTCNIP